MLYTIHILHSRELRCQGLNTIGINDKKSHKNC